MSKPILDEIERRKRKCRKVWALFMARPHVWIAVPELMRVGGMAGWRTRCSEVRAIVTSQGGDIEWNGLTQESAYRYAPQKPLGRSAEKLVQAGLFAPSAGAPWSAR